MKTKKQSLIEFWNTFFSQFDSIEETANFYKIDVVRCFRMLKIGRYYHNKTYNESNTNTTAP